MTFNSLNVSDFDMHLRNIVAVVILQLVIGAGIFASPITLDQALKEALANNKELQVKRLAIRTVESELLKARLWSQSNPELELEVVSDLLTGNSGERILQLGISQEIELGGQRGDRTKLAYVHIELARLELSSAEQELKRNVKAGFYSLLLSQQRLSFAKYIDSLATILRDTTAVRVRNGFRPASELTFLVLDLTTSRTILNKTEAALNEAKIYLLQLLGGFPDSAIEAVGNITYQALSISEDSLASLALTNRPEMQEKKLRKSATSAELDLARSERIPTLKVSAFYSSERTVFTSSDFVGNTTGIQGLKDSDKLFGIKFSMPLPFIDKRNAEIARFRSEIEVNSASGQSIDNQIRYETQAVFRVLKTSEKTLEMVEQVLPGSDSLYQLVQSAYAQGRTTISDYLFQKDRLLKTRIDLLDAYYAYVFAQKECERAVGLDWNQIRQGE